MSAQDVHLRLDPDSPVPYDLTDAGWSAARRLVTSAEAAALAGVTRGRIVALAEADAIDGVLVNHRWLLDRASVEAYARQRVGWALQIASGRRRHPGLPAGPLLALVDAAGGARALGVQPGSSAEKAITRARSTGTMTHRAADRLAVGLLGLTPWEVWGAAYDV